MPGEGVQRLWITPLSISLGAARVAFRGGGAGRILGLDGSGTDAGKHGQGQEKDAYGGRHWSDSRWKRASLEKPADVCTTRRDFDHDD